MAKAKLIKTTCDWCNSDDVDLSDACEVCDGSGYVMVAADLVERTEKQEEIVSILWSFAKDQQTKTHNCKNSEGVSVNMDAVGVALGRIQKLFDLEPVEIQ